MSFFAPALLFGLFAALIPVLIHLLNRRRHRTVKWAAMQFLLKATRESRGKKKLKHFLILACRALAVAGLIFAIARPVVSGLLGWTGGGIDTVVLLLDRSASMEAKEGESDISKREYVLQRVASSMEELGGARLVLIDSATLTPQDVPSPDVLPDISGTQPTATAANIPAMLSKAAEYVQETQPGRTEIWLASDQQRTSWAPEDGRWNAATAAIELLPSNTKLRILSLRGAPARNISIQLLSARRIADELILDLRVLRRQDRGTLTLPVTYSLNGSNFGETITLTGQSLRFQKRFDLQGKKGGGYGSVTLTSDSNPIDNSALFTYDAEHSIATAIVSESLSATESSRYLEIAAAPPGYGSFTSTLYTPESASTIDWNTTSTIIWQAPPPTGRLADRLSTFISSGGTVLMLPPSQDSGAEFLELSWAGLETAPNDQFFIVEEWNRDDGPLADGLDSTPVPASKLRSIQRRLISGDITPLAFWDDNSAFLARRVIDKGTLYLASTLPDYKWSNLADADVLLPLIQRIIQQGSDRLTGAGSIPAGSARSTPLSDETVSRLDSDDDVLSPGLEAGIFMYGERTVAINRPHSEDEWEILQESESRDLLRGTNATVFEQSAENDETLVREIWRIFLIAVLLFLILEAILCLQPKVARTLKQTA